MTIHFAAHVRFFDAKKAWQKSRRPSVFEIVIYSPGENRRYALGPRFAPKARLVLFSFKITEKEKRTKREIRPVLTNKLPGK